MKKILVLEDEDSIRSFVAVNLKRAGYTVLEADRGQQAIEMLAKHKDIVVAILDVMLPDIDGFEVCARARAGGNNVGIIMLTARAEEIDKVNGFMSGADDYVTKPFSPTELTARVDALVRRLGVELPAPPSIVKFGPFEMNTKNRSLEKEGKRIRLTQVEYALVKLFMENPGKAMSRDDILNAVWGHDYFGEPKIVDVNIRRLRLKIEDDTDNPTYLITVWGYGYKWGS